MFEANPFEMNTDEENKETGLSKLKDVRTLEAWRTG